MERRSFYLIQKKQIIALFLAFTLFLVFFPQRSFAQESSAGISVTPSTFEDVVDPGDIYSSVVKVKNETNSPQTYYVSVRDVVDMTPGGRPIFAPAGEYAILGIADWMTVPGEAIEIKAKQTIEISFTIEVPENASPGNHIGGIFIGPKAEKPDEIGTGIGFQLVPIVNMQISGDLIEEAKLIGISTNKLIYGKPEVNFTVTVENVGNVAVRPRGPIEIESMFGEEIGAIVINENAGLIPPYTKRVYEATWVGEGKIFFGRFVANATMAYGQQGV
ncbi:MAG: hypothetical protein KAS07_04120, partial [Candidatus Pacebacteria bacterium]|nr:hypothetical protein [Candidatus Paceibacterota bacterium]